MDFVNMMEHIMACRVCLATDVKLYDMNKYRLKTAYENLTGICVEQSDCLQHVCSYCGSLLQKYKNFRERCACSQEILDILLADHVLVTMHHVKSIDRHAHNLSNPYQRQLIENFDTSIVVKEENLEYNIKPDIDEFTEDFDNYEDNECDIEIKTDGFDNDTYNEENVHKTYNRDGDVSKNSYDSAEEISKNSNDSAEEISKNSYDSAEEISKNADESDEEPLSKKARKKRKKTKTEPKLEKIKVKSEISYDTSEKPKVRNSDIVETNDSTQHKLVILTKKEQIEEVLQRKSSSNYQTSVYKCESCYKGFMTEATYKNHMDRHDPRSGPVCCDVCNMRWPDLRSLRAHSIIAHERKYICKLCGHVSKSSHRSKEHASWHAGVTFRCHACGVTFERSTSYLTHVRLRHPSRHVCHMCGETFIGENGLNMHRKKAHGGEKTSTCTFQECERCHFQFRNKDALLRHSTLTEETGCGNSERPCAQCGDHFDTDALLKEHLLTHQKVHAPRVCSVCSRAFANERTLAAHHQRLHSGTKNSRAKKPRNCVCEICGYNCRSPSTLVQHQRRHSGEKPYPCSQCPARFSVLQRLQIHVRTHTGERPFQCARCPKAFKHKAALNRHDRVHTGVKPYICPQCGKSFSQSNSMKQHCAGVHMKTSIYSRKAANKQSS